MNKILHRVILKCRPGSRFHFGKASDPTLQLSDTSEWLPSDTLFSGLMNTAHKLDTKLADALADAYYERDILHSSAYWCIEPLKKEPSDWIYFLPAPASAMLLCRDRDRVKEVKNVRLVSEAVLRDGLTPDDWFGEKCQIIGGKLVCLKEELAFLPEDLQSLLIVYDKVSAPKVKVRTETKEDALFNRTDVQTEYHPALQSRLSVHLHFLIQSTEEWSQKLNTLLDLLIEEGVGGRRSVGCGILEDVLFIAMNSLPTATAQMNLSLVSPTNASELNKFLHYKLIHRGGRNIDSSRQLKSIKMIGEGGVINGQDVNGKIRDISATPAIPSLRYGHCFHYPIHQKFGDHV